MKDRVCGDPGRYVAKIPVDELPNLQKGTGFLITLTRADSALEPGTPYSKAAVLPDAIAAKICPNIEDPTPADAFEGLYAGKAPEGFGLGKAQKITAAELDNTTAPGWYYGNDAITIDGQACNYWYVRVSAYFDGQQHCFQELHLINSHDSVLHRVMHSRTWGEWEWVDPPMVFGTEYRTTERINGQPVYTVALNCGTGSGSYILTANIKTLLRSTAWTSASFTSPYFDGAPNSLGSDAVVVDVRKDLVIRSLGSNRVNDTVYCQLWYTKE